MKILKTLMTAIVIFVSLIACTEEETKQQIDEKHDGQTSNIDQEIEVDIEDDQGGLKTENDLLLKKLVNASKEMQRYSTSSKIEFSSKNGFQYTSTIDSIYVKKPISIIVMSETTEVEDGVSIEDTSVKLYASENGVYLFHSALHEKWQKLPQDVLAQIPNSMYVNKGEKLVNFLSEFIELFSLSETEEELMLATTTTNNSNVTGFLLDTFYQEFLPVKLGWMMRKENYYGESDFENRENQRNREFNIQFIFDKASYYPKSIKINDVVTPSLTSTNIDKQLIAEINFTKVNSIIEYNVPQEVLKEAN